MTGKEKCRLLRTIRRKIAEENEIPCTERECTHTGECSGTCPYCEAELRQLERELKRRASMGRRVAVAGLAVGMMATAVSCESPFSEGHTTLQGDMADPSGTTEASVSTEPMGTFLAQETTTTPPETDLMGEPALPETEAMGKISTETVVPDIDRPLAGMPPYRPDLPEPTTEPIDPTATETTNLPEETFAPQIAGGIPTAELQLPEPEETP